MITILDEIFMILALFYLDFTTSSPFSIELQDLHRQLVIIMQYRHLTVLNTVFQFLKRDILLKVNYTIRVQINIRNVQTSDFLSTEV